ncbi:MAG TPA: transcription antitermination factor NusB [Fimbriimonadaceae bacterium]|nr:transcription antitermination factor NusB [Fimbriimonadaceae bacterium]
MTKPENRTKSRRSAREAAFQAAYQCFVGGIEIDKAVHEALTRGNYSQEAAELVRALATGAVTKPEETELRFAKFLRGDWSIDRLAVTDRLLLRLAVFEMYERPETPKKVVIAESVRLAKKYGTAESGPFVNGVLAKVFEDCPKED